MSALRSDTLDRKGSPCSLCLSTYPSWTVSSSLRPQAITGTTVSCAMSRPTANAAGAAWRCLQKLAVAACQRCMCAEGMAKHWLPLPRWRRRASRSKFLRETSAGRQTKKCWSNQSLGSIPSCCIRPSRTQVRSTTFWPRSMAIKTHSSHRNTCLTLMASEVSGGRSLEIWLRWSSDSTKVLVPRKANQTAGLARSAVLRLPAPLSLLRSCPTHILPLIRQPKISRGKCPCDSIQGNAASHGKSTDL
mmetsp:Transcript_35291/g.93982  ORF Transcript_35291/g.93982 Transcript_35291/m.93982 type:complete len:247 (+) Transcript_35291:1396-2136(+)